MSAKCRQRQSKKIPVCPVKSKADGYLLCVPRENADDLLTLVLYCTQLQSNAQARTRTNLQKKAFRNKSVGKMSADLYMLIFCSIFALEFKCVGFGWLSCNLVEHLRSDARVFFYCSAFNAFSFISRVTSLYREKARELATCPVIELTMRWSPVAAYAICVNVRRARWLVAISHIGAGAYIPVRAFLTITGRLMDAAFSMYLMARL